MRGDEILMDREGEFMIYVLTVLSLEGGGNGNFLVPFCKLKVK